MRPHSFPMQLVTNLKVGALERLLSSLDWFARYRGASKPVAAHLVTGEQGEEAAQIYLRRLGFVIVAERWNDGPAAGDIDLIAWSKDTLCFVEVKTRSSREFATASSAVDRHKRDTLRLLARQYMRQLPSEDPYDSGSAIRPETRFDIVTVYEVPGRKREIQLIPGAFGWSERSGIGQ